MISFFIEVGSFKLDQKTKLKKWISEVINLHQKQVGEINYIFCDDEYLLDINKTYLAHDFYTDIITFDQSDLPNKIEGEIYISIERVKDNSEILKVDFREELKRVVIHGILHLVGFKDKTEKEKKKMRALENEMLQLIN
jgi:probable rRNA maturation factor